LIVPVLAIVVQSVANWGDMQNFRRTALMTGFIAAVVLSIAGWGFLKSIEAARQSEAKEFV